MTPDQMNTVEDTHMCESDDCCITIDLTEIDSETEHQQYTCSCKYGGCYDSDCDDN